MVKLALVEAEFDVIVNVDAATAQVLMNDGSGGLTAPVDYPVAIGPRRLIVEDFNDDAIIYGVSYWASLVETLLPPSAGEA